MITKKKKKEGINRKSRKEQQRYVMSKFSSQDVRRCKISVEATTIPSVEDAVGIEMSSIL